MSHSRPKSARRRCWSVSGRRIACRVGRRAAQGRRQLLDPRRPGRRGRRRSRRGHDAGRPERRRSCLRADAGRCARYRRGRSRRRQRPRLRGLARPAGRGERLPGRLPSRRRAWRPLEHGTRREQARMPAEAHEDDEASDHHHGGVDPHAWQSVANAEIYVKNIADGAVRSRCRTIAATIARTPPLTRRS